MTMDLLLFIILSLSTWRLASLLVNEIGPFDMFLKIRDEYYNRKYLHKFMNLDCVWCISVYLGWIIAFLHLGFTFDVFFYGIALSASAIIIESIVRYFIAENEKVLKQQERKKEDGLQV